MQKTNNNSGSLSKEAFSLFKKRFLYSFPITFGFILLFIAILAFGVFFPFTLWISVPFLLLPLCFAYTLSLSDGHQDNELSNQRTIAYFLSYFHTPFYGSYRVIRNFFLSLFWTVLFGIALYFCIVPIFSSLSSEFVSAFANFSGYLEQRNYESAAYLLANDPDISRFFLLYSLLTYVFFTLNFLARLLGYSLNPFFRLNFGYGPTALSNHIFQGGLRIKRSEYFHDYISSTWWLFLLFLLFDAAGVAIGWFYLLSYLSPIGIVAFGIGLGFLAISPFLSYYVWFLNLLNQKFESTFIDYYIHLAEETFLAAREANELSEEEMKYYEEQIAKGKKAKEDIEAKKDDEENGKDSDE